MCVSPSLSHCALCRHSSPLLLCLCRADTELVFMVGSTSRLLSPGFAVCLCTGNAGPWWDPDSTSFALSHRDHHGLSSGETSEGDGDGGLKGAWQGMGLGDTLLKTPVRRGDHQAQGGSGSHQGFLVQKTGFCYARVPASL